MKRLGGIPLVRPVGAARQPRRREQNGELQEQKFRVNETVDRFFPASAAKRQWLEVLSAVTNAYRELHP